MACSCSKRKNKKFVWTSDPDAEGGTEQVIYPTEIQAKAKVIRMGGSYVMQG